MISSDTNFKLMRKFTKAYEKPTLLCKGPVSGMKQVLKLDID